MRYEYRVSTFTVATMLLIHIHSADAQTLLVYYDFEGDSAASIEDVSGYVDGSGAVAPANGTLVDTTASIVADTIDPNLRGDVLKVGDTGFGAEVPHARKMDFRNSYTLSTWFRTADSLAFWQLAAGINGGPRIFAPHWGLGGVGAANMTNELLWSFGLTSGFEPVQFVSPTGFVDGTQWHHVLLTWNAVEQELWGYYDGFDAGDPDDPGLSPVQTNGDTLMANPDAPLQMGDPQDGPLTGPFDSTNPHPDFWIDDVALWQGYAPPSVVADIFAGSVSVHDVASMLELPSQTADFNGDLAVNGADFLHAQRNVGLDDITPFAVTVADGDGNGDMKVDSLDLQLWQGEYGTVIPPPASTTVPEPASCLLMMGALIALSVVERGLR